MLDLSQCVVAIQFNVVDDVAVGVVERPFWALSHKGEGREPIPGSTKSADCQEHNAQEH